MKRGAAFVAAHVALPIALGSVIYVLWRSPRLKVFRWLGSAGLGPPVERIREAAMPLGQRLPEWVVFSVPDGLWVYAVTALMGWIWLDGRSGAQGWPWLASGLLVGCGSEVLQAFGWFPGTFDPVDLGLCGLAGLAAVWQARRAHLSP